MMDDWENEFLDVKVIKEFIDEVFNMMYCGEYDSNDLKGMGQIICVGGSIVDRIYQYIDYHGHKCRSFSKDNIRLMMEFFDKIKIYDCYDPLMERLIEKHKGDEKYLVMLKNYKATVEFGVDKD